MEWDDNFRLYMTSKLSNPHYGPEVGGKTSIINYGVTQQGLAEQLLGVVVAHERPDLEEARRGLVAEMSENKALLKQLEDTLLRELSAATGGWLLINPQPPPPAVDRQLTDSLVIRQHAQPAPLVACGLLLHTPV